jgi:predicted nuclease of restriction endonuclease-like (RecB) superfamily
MKPSKPSKSGAKRLPAPSALEAPPEEQAFAEVVEMIQAARGQALAAVNTALIDLYWRVGEYISRKLETAAWGEGVVNGLADYIQRRQPNLRGFTWRNLFRMRQFFDAYKEQEKVSALLTQLPWTHHLMILSRSKRPEEREFYVRLTAQEKWSSQELERQLASALFERAVLNPPKVSAALRQLHPEHQGSLSRHLPCRIADTRGAAPMRSSKPSCRHDEKVSPLVRQIPGSQNLLGGVGARRPRGEIYDRR